MTTRFTNARLSDASMVDVLVADGVIVAIEPIDPADPAGSAVTAMSATTTTSVDPTEISPKLVDLGGWLVLPAPVEPHAHLDKAFLAEVEPNPTGDLLGAIAAMERLAPHRNLAETIERAERAARLYADRGYLSIRTHVDITSLDGLRNVEALSEVRVRLRDVIGIEIVALTGIGHSATGGRSLIGLLHDALETGADLVGGCPHLEPSPAASIEHLLQVATEHGVGIDLHCDENLDPASSDLRLLVEAVDAGFDLPVTASHCVSLGQLDETSQQQIAESVAATNITIVGLPLTNLYLQGRGVRPMPRGLAPLALLQSVGVRVLIGTDNLQDPFNPIGRGCPFDIAAAAVVAAHVLPEDAWTMASGVGVDLEVGMRADLIAVDATTVREAIANAPTRTRLPG